MWRIHTRSWSNWLFPHAGHIPKTDLAADATTDALKRALPPALIGVVSLELLGSRVDHGWSRLNLCAGCEAQIVQEVFPLGSELEEGLIKVEVGGKSVESYPFSSKSVEPRNAGAIGGRAGKIWRGDGSDRGATAVAPGVAVCVL